MNRILFLAHFAFCLLGCNSHDKKKLTLNEFVSFDSLKKYSLDSKLLSVQARNDTLIIVTTNPFAYFPFEKHSSVNEFVSKLEIFSSEMELQNHEDDSSEPADTLYNLAYHKSKIKILLDSDQRLVNIVSGEINDKGIILKNGMEIGQTKTFVISKFFKKLPANYKEIKVIEIVSGLIGIWHYYEFKEDQLIRIKFDTDYTFKK
jgi:hypothetical protein